MYSTTHIGKVLTHVDCGNVAVNVFNFHNKFVPICFILTQQVLNYFLRKILLKLASNVYTALVKMDPLTVLVLF